MVALATEYGRYGYRRVAALLRAEGFALNHKRVERLWRREGLKVPARQPKRGWLWLNDGSCVRLRGGTLFTEPGSPWENGFIESFNGKLRDEPLDREVFDTLLEATVLIECWRVGYNTVRPHSSLGYRSPAPEAIVPWSPAFGASLLGPGPMAGAVVAL